MNDEERKYLAELGELIGTAVCSVLDYTLNNSNNNEAAVKEAFANVAVKIGEA